MKKLIFAALIIAVTASCSHKWGNTYTEGTKTMQDSKVKEKQPTAPTQVRKVRLQETGGSVAMLPNATVFRMSGDFQNNVAVTLGPNGQLTYFPAPTDITADSRPIDLGNGWWLNCQGLGPNSVFTKYTFAQYAELPQVPDPSQLKLDIIPGAKVTQFMELPMKMNEVLANPEAACQFLK